MNKKYGTKIGIKFTQPLIGDVSGLENPTGFRPAEESLGPGFISSSGDYSATYAADKAFDGSITTYWRASSATAGQWIQVDLVKPVATAKFRWYVNSHKPRAFILQGSINGTTWVTLLDTESPNTVGWQEFSYDDATKYRYYRWTLNSRWSSYYYVYEIEIYARLPIGNEVAFSVTGKEPQYVKFPSESLGPLIDGDYEVEKVEKMPPRELWNDDFSGTVDGLIKTGGLRLAIYASTGAYTICFAVASMNQLPYANDATPRICLESTTPASTSIIIDYACTDDNSTEPVTWITVADQGVLTINDNYIWLRYTLKTETPAATPVITEVWLEEPSPPVGAILLTMKNQKRFRNAEGDLTVKYDHTEGNLAGAGGPVQSFEEDFTPESLWRLPKPYGEEKIKVSLVDYEIELNTIQHIVVGDGPYPTNDPSHQKFKQDWSAEKVSVSLTAFSLVLTHINDLDV